LLPARLGKRLRRTSSAPSADSARMLLRKHKFKKWYKQTKHNNRSLQTKGRLFFRSRGAFSLKLWNFCGGLGDAEGWNGRGNGGLKSGSFWYKVIIAKKPALANRLWKLFAERLRFDIYVFW
jgi:hypothetical protein